jgi:helix-turn-helix protein|tara:strand:+ start:1654 stop:2904 length:1251 start_codon:yes stop_codon:yes gene_type:complete
MAHDDAIVRPETVALDALIKATLAGFKGEGAASSPDAMLFMGNWHQAIPAMVIQDPILEPVDKVVWMVIMSHARETGGRTAFPDYDTIASQTNVSSTSTVSRAIAILRLTRWLTLCAKLRQKSGRFTGNIYVLHDEPLPLVDALHLDDAYMAFVSQSQQHHHGRVRLVAQAISESMDESIRGGQNLAGTESGAERRLQAAQFLTERWKKTEGTSRYFSFTGASVNRLKQPLSDRSDRVNDRSQNSKAEEKVNYSSGCSSDYKTTTTTTPTLNSNSNENALPAASSLSDKPLIYPPRLSDNQKLLADRYLGMIAPEGRQSVLDELQGRLDSEQRGMKPVYDELRFLHSLCKAADKGEFIPNLGIKVAEGRLSRAQPSPPPVEPQQEALNAEERERTRAYGIEQIAKLRLSFNAKDDP